MRIFYALGYLAGSAILAASRPSEADRLRAENRELTREVYDLAAICDALRVQLSRAEAMLQHPSHRGAVDNAQKAVEGFGLALSALIDDAEADAFALVLEDVETVGDLLWVIGGDE